MQVYAHGILLMETQQNLSACPINHQVNGCAISNQNFKVDRDNQRKGWGEEDPSLLESLKEICKSL